MFVINIYTYPCCSIIRRIWLLVRLRLSVSVSIRTRYLLGPFPSYSAVSRTTSSVPVPPDLRADSMPLFGTPLDRAWVRRLLSLMLVDGSLPPLTTAARIWNNSFALALLFPRSVTAFFLLIFDHLLCPASLAQETWRVRTANSGLIPAYALFWYTEQQCTLLHAQVPSAETEPCTSDLGQGLTNAHCWTLNQPLRDPRHKVPVGFRSLLRLIRLLTLVTCCLGKNLRRPSRELMQHLRVSPPPLSLPKSLADVLRVSHFPRLRTYGRVVHSTQTFSGSTGQCGLSIASDGDWLSSTRPKLPSETVGEGLCTVVICQVSLFLRGCVSKNHQRNYS